MTLWQMQRSCYAVKHAILLAEPRTQREYEFRKLTICGFLHFMQIISILRITVLVCALCLQPNILGGLSRQLLRALNRLSG